MVRIALAQMNPTVGDLAGNTALIVEAIKRARDSGAQILAVPELAVPGYPPEDLVLKRSFVRANLHAVEEVAAATDDLLAFVGFVDGTGSRLYNAAAVCLDGRVVAVYRK